VLLPEVALASFVNIWLRVFWKVQRNVKSMISARYTGRYGGKGSGC
jgi:hypothetical protein